MAPITQSASQPELRSPRNCCKKTLYGSDWSRLATGRKYSQQPGYILFSHNPTALWIILFHAGSLNGRLRNRFFLPRNDHGNNSAGGRKCFWAWQRPFVHKASDMFVFLASQDALEVMLVSQWVSESLTLRTELTDVTLVSEDTYWGLYWQDSGN